MNDPAARSVLRARLSVPAGPSRRLSRALRRLGPAAPALLGLAGAAALSAADPGLAGRWQRDGPDGAVLRVHHVGGRLHGVFEDGSGTSFIAQRGEDGVFRGRVLTDWSEEWIRNCGEAERFNDTYVVRISAGGDRMDETYQGAFGDAASCRIFSPSPQRHVLHRISP